MASLLVEGDVVTVSLSVAEKVEALHGDVSVPRTAVLSARVVPDGMEEVHGLKGNRVAGRDHGGHLAGRRERYLRGLPWPPAGRRGRLGRPSL